MATTVYQTDKRSGITYAYHSASYWDKEKKQSRSKRELIGRVDPETQAIVPTDGRCRKDKRDLSALRMPARRFYGATYLLDAIAHQMGLLNDLKACFPQYERQIRSIAYYLILEDHGSLQRFDKWARLHHHPHGAGLSSQRASELFSAIDEGSRHRFFALQGRHKVDHEFWVYDTTTLSSYSHRLRQVCRGHNKEHDLLSQLNLAVVYGAQSNRPFYYRTLAGNLPDVTTLRPLLSDLSQLGFSKVRLVMDRGFYSEANINALYRQHRTFLLSAKNSLRLVRTALDPIYDQFRTFEHYDSHYELYTRSVRTYWAYKPLNPTDAHLTLKRRLYLHYYFNIERAAEQEKAFDRRLIQWREELLENQRIKAHERFYDQYFTVSQTPKRGLKVQVNYDEVAKTKRYYGYCVLMTNHKMHAIEALQVYRNKDVVEKAFGNLKERLNMRRLLVSSEQSLEGKLFVAFIALILLSYIKKQMQDHNLFKTYTLGTLLDQLDVIECFEAPRKRLRVGEILQKQVAIYEAMGVNPPASL